MPLILIPAIVTFAVTLLRLYGELNKWSTTYFGPTAGGGGSLVGISWLIPVFGIYFAWVLAKRGEGPERPWKSLGIALLAYAFAARVPVAILMIFAIFGHWGTHYDVPPPDPAAAADATTIGLLAHLGYDPCDINTLCARSGLTADAVSAMLLQLELEGNVAGLPGGRYQRSS